MSKKHAHKRRLGSKTVDEERSQKSFWLGLGSFEKSGVIALGLVLIYGLMSITGLGDVLINTVAGNSPFAKADKKDLSGQRKSLFSAINPPANPSPTPTPQLSKEYIYAGSRLLAVEDANATAVPPADLAVWRPDSATNTGTWWVMGGQGSQQVAVQWGTDTDTPVPGDYDGDGQTDFCVFRDGEGKWYIQQSSDQSMVVHQFGQTGDTPVPADYDGDGKTDVAFFRSGTWYVLRSSDLNFYSVAFGLSTDKPTPADFDGDGMADLAVWRSSAATFYVTKSSDSSVISQAYGISGDVPAVADYDGDGKADYSVRRGNNWFVLKSTDGQTLTYSWGVSTDIEVPNDYDGDGKADIGVWREHESYQGAGDGGTWYILNSADSSQRIVQWGMQNDIPVPAFYRR